MSNMSYCRFENTAADLRDCLENIDEDLSESESAARVRLVKLCRQILIDAPEEIMEAAGILGGATEES